MSAAILALGKVEASLRGKTYVAQVDVSDIELLRYLFFSVAWQRWRVAQYHSTHCNCGRLVLS